VDYTSSNEDYTDDGDEDAESYRPGGYHPVHIGDLYNKRYLVVQKLGWGHFSTVWMCQDITTAPASASGSSTPATYVAMKIQKSASHYREAAFDEIELLRCIRTASATETFSKEISSRTSSPSRRPNSGVVSLLDHFEHNGPHGKHVCMVFEMLGENLLKVIKNYDYRGISIPVVQNLTRQVCRGLDFLHRHCGIIHTDLKPENILIGIAPSPPSSLFVKSLIEQQATQNKIQQKKKKTKTSKKSSNKQSSVNHSMPQEAKGVSSHSSSADMNGLSTEQKKKIKKKMKKQRQKARKGDKGTGKKKNGVKGHGDGTGLPPVDELREMALMEQASEPLAPLNTVTTAVLRPSNGDLEESDDDDVDDDNVDDGDEEDDEAVNSSLHRVQDPQSQMKALVKNVLSPRDTLPWLRHTLFAAINFRFIQSTAQYPDLLPSPIKIEGHSSASSGSVIRNELQTSPIHFPRLAHHKSGEDEICKVIPISSQLWSFSPRTKRSKIYMVSLPSHLCEILSSHSLGCDSQENLEYVESSGGSSVSSI
jgi:serine/threonine protein kinase